MVTLLPSISDKFHIQVKVILDQGGCIFEQHGDLAGLEVVVGEIQLVGFHIPIRETPDVMLRKSRKEILHHARRQKRREPFAQVRPCFMHAGKLRVVLILLCRRLLRQRDVGALTRFRKLVEYTGAVAGNEERRIVRVLVRLKRSVDLALKNKHDAAIRSYKRQIAAVLQLDANFKFLSCVRFFPAADETQKIRAKLFVVVQYEREARDREPLDLLYHLLTSGHLMRAKTALSVNGLK